MFLLATLVFFLSIPAFILGMIAPRVYGRFFKNGVTRMKLFKIFSIVILGSFVIMLFTVPPVDEAASITTKENVTKTIGNDPDVTTPEIATPEETTSAAVAEQPSIDTESPALMPQEETTTVDTPSNTTTTPPTPSTETTTEPEPTVAATEPAATPAASTSTPTSTPTTSTTAPAAAQCTCSSDLYNCSDFATHDAAQAVHDCCIAQVGYDIHGLDGNDHDGLACESKP